MLRIACIIGALVLPFAAQSEDVTVLLEEQIHIEAGGTLPEGANLKVTSNPLIKDAILLQAFWMDPATGQFVADVLRETGEVQRVTGFAIATMRVPVPTRQVMPGEILGAGDLTEIELPVARIARFAVTERAALEGKEVKRLLTKGRLVMSQSVIPPRLVQRGQRVKIILNDRGLSLVATGKALADAAHGEEVKVVNLSSNLSVVGIASADGTVEIIK